MSRRWRKPLLNASRRHRRAARCGALRNSTMPPAAGAASSASSRGSRPAPREPIPALSSPTWRGGRAKQLYQRLYCARGQAENHIKAWKNHLAADRTSCHEATANQFRLFLHAGAYWLLWSMRRLMPKASAWRVMQFDTLRLRLIKIAARVVELKKQIKIHLPSSTPDQAIFGIILSRLPRLIT